MQGDNQVGVFRNTYDINDIVYYKDEIGIVIAKPSGNELDILIPMSNGYFNRRIINILDCWYKNKMVFIS